MESEKVKEIKELLRCMNGEKACTNCYINDIAQEQETCCINVVADMTLDLINELERENELLRNAKVVYETVDYCYEDLKKAEIRIAELEMKNKDYYDRLNNLQTYIDNHEEIWKGNTNNALKQFAERLIEKKVKLGDRFNIYDIDETLKEFIK